MFPSFIKYAVFFLVFARTVLLLEHNGWIPLTENEGLRKLIGGQTRRSLLDNHFKNPTYDSFQLKTQNEDSIKLVTPQHIFQIGKESVSNPMESSKIYENENIYHQQDIFNDDMFHPKNPRKEEDIPEIKRKPKALFKTNLKDNEGKAVTSTENITIRKLGIDYLEEPSNQDVAKESKYYNTYEVSEDSSDALKESLDLNKATSYTYKVPGAVSANNQTDFNITSTLVNALSKYNIRLEDDLPNYSLSRQNPVQRPNFMLLPIPFKMPTRFNSFNHVPVDPLLAVFLSNYGYYLPGSFGIQSRYRNLYGYLAFNNIHNNKPFGSYKIFSDTDSSN